MSSRYYWLIVVIGMVIFSTFILPAFAGIKNVSDFKGSISYENATSCIKVINNSECKLKDLFTDYKICVQNLLMRQPVCRQSLTFFKLTNGGIFKKIIRYNTIDVIQADYVYIADQGIGYFLIMPNGQLITLPISISKKELKLAPGYQDVATHYPHVSVWQILDFPDAVELPHHRYRLVFTQQLKDGCNACTLAGKARIAYDFSTNGKVFYGMKILKLIPRSKYEQ